MATTLTSCGPGFYFRYLGGFASHVLRISGDDVVSHPPFAPSASRGSLIVFSVVTVLVGLGSGLCAICLGLLLHFLEHVAFGYNLVSPLGHDSFLQGVSNAPPLRRFAVVIGCGLVVGIGAASLYRWGKPLASVSKAVGSNVPTMPLASTLVESVLQIVAAALGSPLGHEVAPRAVGALIAGRLCQLTGLSVRHTQIMVACGAGAGLAALYNVPIAATIFVAEALLRSARPSILLPAIVACAIAAVVAQASLGGEPFYAVAILPVGIPLVVAAVVSGPIFGLAGVGFRRLMNRAQLAAPTGSRLLVSSVLAFVIVGLLAFNFPQLLGNGRGPAQLTFSDGIEPRLAITLLALKVAVIAVVLKGGARGGLMTPGFASGALLATILGSIWNLFLPDIPLAVFSVVGAATFLGTSMSMPITAIALAMEFMHLPTVYLVPLAGAAAGAFAVRLFLERPEAQFSISPMIVPEGRSDNPPQQFLSRCPSNDRAAVNSR